MSLKLDMQSSDGVAQNIEKIAALFPNCVTETAEGLKIDFDQLQQELSADIVEGAKERYRLDWPGKREAIVTANLPTTNTLRPVREDSVDFDNTENLYIEGDNLEVLKILQESYLNKVKMIYIDPPYNTGKDFVYRDNFTVDSEQWAEVSGQKDEEGNRLFVNSETSGRYHSDWLTMMYPRLKLARNLLTEDGVIFISIDDHEVHNLRKMCDEIFGEGNFIGNIIIKSNPRGSQSETYIAGLHEYLLIYSKNSFYSSIVGHKLSEEMKIEYKYIENGKNYRLLGLRQRGGFWRRSERPNLFFKIYINPETREVSTIKEDNFTEYIEPIQPTTGEDGTWRWSKEKINSNKNELIAKIVNRNNKKVWDVFQKDFLNKDGEKRTKAKSIWDERSINYQNGTIEIKNLLISGIFDFPKPTYLIKQCLEMLSHNPSDIILDFFSGSATTAHAVMQLNKEDGGHRKFIMVQLPEATDETSEAYKAGYKNICEIGKERIRRAGRLVVSEQLAVVSGQQAVDRKEESKINHKTKGSYGDKNVSGVNRLAEGDESDQPGLFDSKKAAEGRTVRSFGSDETSSGIDSVKHSGGTSEEFNKGVSPILSDSQRLKSGIGNATSSMRESGISNGGGHSGSDGFSGRSEQNDRSTFKETGHSPLTTDHSPLTIDIGFRVYRLDSSNMKDIYYKPHELQQTLLDNLENNVKEDRTAEDLLTQIMLDWGLPLSLPIERKTISGKEVFAIAGDSLYACFDEGIDEAFAKEIAQEHPLRIVFRDGGFKDDTAKENVRQLLRQLSKETEMRVI